MKLNISELLKEKGKSRYWLAKEIGVTQAVIRRLADNKSESTKFETLENICLALDCSPNDLLIIEKIKSSENKQE